MVGVGLLFAVGGRLDGLARYMGHAFGLWRSSFGHFGIAGAHDLIGRWLWYGASGLFLFEQFAKIGALHAKVGAWLQHFGAV
jgi:hypothetical protein